jgi:hypothetical protein
MFDVKTHNGCITIHNKMTGNHRTFKIRTQNDKSKFAPGSRVVSLLTGPDREDYRNWQSFGFANPSGIVVFRKYADTEFAKFSIMLNNKAQYEALGCEYMIESTCRVCNRQLTEPESIRSGIGPVCAGRP